MSANSHKGFEEHYFPSVDGLKLYARDYGGNNPETKDRLPLVCLAGLTRNSRDFHHFALALSGDKTAPRRVVTIDTRGRGQSEWDKDPSHYNFMMEAQDAVAGCQELGIGKTAFIGTSRGGLILHILAVMAPDLLGPVIFNDIGPAIGVEGLKVIQSYLSKKVTLQNFDEAVAALKATHGETFSILDHKDWLDFAEATLRETESGLVADCDPAIASAMAETDLNQPLPELWDQFKTFPPGPMMVIRGENSLLLTQEIVEKMKAERPDLQVLIAHGQGHAPILHLASIEKAIMAFLGDV